jgi:predicted MFS family arabinose efflux permease
VGTGEGVVLPSMNAMVATHVALPQKARALGAIFTGFHCGNLIGLALSPLIILAYGWKVLFLQFGLLGGPLLALWLAFTPKHAQERQGPRSPALSLDEAAADGRAQRQSMTARELLKRRATWAIVVANFVNHWGYFIFLSWIPSYFANVFGMDMRKSSLMAFVPWIAMAVGSSLAGFIADFLVQKLPVRVQKTGCSV